jgi:hypothetical protein
MAFAGKRRVVQNPDVLSTFLGKKVVEYGKLTPDEKHALSSVNGNLMGSDVAMLSIALQHGYISQVGPTSKVFTTEDNKRYWPLYISSANYHAPMFAYLTVLGAPSLKHLTMKLRDLLKSDYPGTNQIEVDRYAFNFDKLSPIAVKTLIETAKQGGIVVDYSWIAPLQDLYEVHEDQKRKKSTTPILKYGSKQQLAAPSPKADWDDAWGYEPPSFLTKKSVQASPPQKKTTSMFDQLLHKRFNTLAHDQCIILDGEAKEYGSSTSFGFYLRDGHGDGKTFTEWMNIKKKEVTAALDKKVISYAYPSIKRSNKK